MAPNWRAALLLATALVMVQGRAEGSARPRSETEATTAVPLTVQDTTASVSTLAVVSTEEVTTAAPPTVLPTCPTECQWANCVDGNGANGGQRVYNDRHSGQQSVIPRCAYRCTQRYTGGRYCGTGAAYEQNGSIDCSGCFLIPPLGPCTVPGMFWEPKGKKVAALAYQDCQNECFGDPFCETFTWWPDGSCHLQGNGTSLVNASKLCEPQGNDTKQCLERQPVSGPRACGSEYFNLYPYAASQNWDPTKGNAALPIAVATGSTPVASTPAPASGLPAGGEALQTTAVPTAGAATTAAPAATTDASAHPSGPSGAVAPSPAAPSPAVPEGAGAESAVAAGAVVTSCLVKNLDYEKLTSNETLMDSVKGVVKSTVAEATGQAVNSRDVDVSFSRAEEGVKVRAEAVPANASMIEEVQSKLDGSSWFGANLEAALSSLAAITKVSNGALSVTDVHSRIQSVSTSKDVLPEPEPMADVAEKSMGFPWRWLIAALVVIGAIGVGIAVCLSFNQQTKGTTTKKTRSTRVIGSSGTDELMKDRKEAKDSETQRLMEDAPPPAAPGAACGDAQPKPVWCPVPVYTGMGYPPVQAQAPIYNSSPSWLPPVLYRYVVPYQVRTSPAVYMPLATGLSA